MNPTLIRLRDVRDDDLPIFFAHQEDPEACRMAAFPPRTWDAFLSHWRMNVLGDARNGKQTIVVDGEVAGNVVSWDHDVGRMVGYWLGRAYWGRGIATAALAAYVAHETTRPLHAYVAAHNLGSIRVLEKCGFRPVGGSEMGPDGVEEFLFRRDARRP